MKTTRNASRALLVLLLWVIAGCADNGPSTPKIGPFLLQIDPADHGRFDRIAESPVEERKKKQIRYLTTNGHDLKWFSDMAGTIEQHDTVQIIYFNYRDYVVGFCSGVFLSDGYIASAGHCNSAVYGLSRVGVGCRENVLFAYKRAKDAAVEYYACDQVAAFDYEKIRYEFRPNEQGDPETRWRAKDHVLFRLADLRPKPKLNPSAARGIKWVATGNTLQTGAVVLALVVDPPANNKDLVSHYDLAVGEIVDKYEIARTRKLRGEDFAHFTPLINGLQSGNSGGPIYLMDSVAAKSSSARAAEVRTVGGQDRIYLGPYHGQFPGNVYTFPEPATSWPLFREAQPR